MIIIRYLEDARWDLEYSKRRLDQATVRIIAVVIAWLYNSINSANKSYWNIDIVTYLVDDNGNDDDDDCECDDDDKNCDFDADDE